MHSIAELKQKAVDMLFDFEVDGHSLEQVQAYLSLVGMVHYWDNGPMEKMQDALVSMLQDAHDKEVQDG